MKPVDPREHAALAVSAHGAAFIDAMLDAVWLVDGRSRQVVAANAAAGALLGVAPQALAGRDITTLCDAPEDLLFWQSAADGRAGTLESQTWLARPGGGPLPVTRRVSRLAPHGGADALYVVVAHDRSEQRRVEQTLEAHIVELAVALESTADGLLITDLAGRIRRCNPSFAELWSVPEALLRRRDDDALHEHMRRSVADPTAYMQRLAALECVELVQAVDAIALRSGRVLQRVARPQVAGDACIGRVYAYRDITERLATERRVEHLTHTDALTGLPTRRLLADRGQFAIAHAQREGTPFALLFADVDRFKHVNDTLGHECGDRVLADVAERLTACLRQVDTVTRLGGDEFVMLVHQADAAGAEAAARRIMDAMAQPFRHGDTGFTVTCSIGIALYPRDGVQFEDLVRRADAAMHAVKGAGRAAYRFHRGGDADPGHAGRRLQLDHAMRHGLARGDFRVHYQPQVDLATGQVCGAEALLRWRDPALGDVSPGEFIPIAEESGFIVAIGDWVLRRAVQQAALWQAQGRGLVVSVNVSAVQFHRAGFVEGVAGALQEAGLPAALLELELTESILIQNAPDALRRLQALSALGVKLAIDDFGTGYSSLGYLKRFPIDRLKIDRSFVRGLPGDASDAGIVHAIVNLGRALRLEVVAEGVETEAQRAFLAQSGCEQYQGFLFAPALDSASFEARCVHA
jgi:diguanylate cyclase (GGDEF)-like protein